MHVLIVSQYFWPENFQINTLAKGLVQKGHKVTVLTGMPNYPAGKFFKGYGWRTPAFENHLGINIVRVPIIPRGNSGKLRLALNYLSFVISGIVLGSRRCRDNYDVTLVFGASPILQALPAIWLRHLRKIPHVHYVLDLWPESVVATDAIRSGLILKCLDRLVQWIYRKSDFLLISSQPFKEKLIMQGVPPKNIAYLPNSADSMHEIKNNQAAIAKKLGVPTGFWVMYAGNIAKAQSFTTLLDAAKRCMHLETLQFIIVGDGHLRQSMQQRVKDEGLKNVYFVGRHPPDSMPPIFAAADVLLTTLRNQTIFSLTVPARIQSYLSAGKPIISACGKAAADVIHAAGAGFSVSPENPDELARAIFRLHEMPLDERQALGKKGKTYFENHFTHDKVVDQLERHLESIINDEKKRASLCTD